MAVKHPNVVRIHEVIEDGEAPVIVMDYLVGESLGDRLGRLGSLSIREFSAIFVPIVSAIGSAHAHGIVHRDLKPENVFIAEGEQVRVLDFGIAKLTATEADAKGTGDLTNTGALLGTPYYMSPEQVFGDKSIDHRSDIWSLGVITVPVPRGRAADRGREHRPAAARHHDELAPQAARRGEGPA